MLPVKLAFLGLFLMSCAHNEKNRNFEERLNQQSASSLTQVENNLKDLLSNHKELSDSQKNDITNRVQLFILNQRNLREREQKLLELGLGDAIYSSEVSKAQWKREVKQLYDLKAENVLGTVNDIHNITQDPPVTKDFFHEFPILMREVR